MAHNEDFKEQHNNKLLELQKNLERASSKELMGKLIALHKENKILQTQKKILSKNANFTDNSEELYLNFINSVSKMQELYAASKNSFTEHLKEENIFLNEEIKKKENQGLEEAKGASKEYGCDFFNFVKYQF